MENKYQEALNYINKSICTLLALQGVQDEQVIKNLHILQELINKETPKYVNREIIGYASLAGMPELEIHKTTCPICKKELCYEKYNYCPDCGQHLDWSNE